VIEALGRRVGAASFFGESMDTAVWKHELTNEQMIDIEQKLARLKDLEELVDLLIEELFQL
jgi:hypothetical protein